MSPATNVSTMSSSRWLLFPLFLALATGNMRTTRKGTDLNPPSLNKERILTLGQPVLDCGSGIWSDIRSTVAVLSIQGSYVPHLPDPLEDP